jgi:uncharacterized protein YigA (DUF484 family)
MSSADRMDASIRDKIISEPDVILEDMDVMRALVGANDRQMGDNVVDMRGLAMDRMEARLSTLENTHQSVIAAAYENLAGTQQIHRAILRMLDPIEFESFLKNLAGDVADILRIDGIKLVLESAQSETQGLAAKLGDALIVAEPGSINRYLNHTPEAPERQVTLRRLKSAEESVFQTSMPEVRSEACLRLDFGQGRLPGLLVMGSATADQFNPAQGTDLLAFFAGVFERSMRRWLS